MDRIVQTNQRINTVKNLPVKLSKEFQHAIDLFKNVTAPEAPALPDWSQVKVEDLHGEYVAYLNGLLASTVVDAQQNHFVSALASYVLQQSNREYPKLVEQLRPMFNDAAKRYKAAVDKLPEQLTDAALVNGGTIAVEAYQAAQTAASEMGVYADFVGRTDVDGGTALRVIRPETFEGLKTVVQGKAEGNQTLTKVNPHLFTAVKNSVPLQLNTPGEAEAIREELEREATAKKRGGVQFK